jgi:hypothetical protein
LSRTGDKPFLTFEILLQLVRGPFPGAQSSVHIGAGLDEPEGASIREEPSESLQKWISALPLDLRIC